MRMSACAAYSVTTQFCGFSARVRGRAGGGITCLQIIPQALQLDEDASAAVDMLDLALFAELADAEDSQT